jgi:hypothetical protein
MLLLIFAIWGPNVPEARVRKGGRKDATNGVSSLSALQKVFDPFFQLLMSYLALKHMFCNSYWAQGNKDSHAHLDIIF